MFRKTLILASILMLCLTAACSGQIASASPNNSSITALNLMAGAQMTVKDKLGIGILSLEGTGLSISLDQAEVLLPLWQAVNSLGADKSASSEEIAALYAQIQETLSAGQTAQIEQFTWSQAELASLIQQHQTQTSLETSTARSTSSTSISSQGQNMDGGPGGEFLPPDGGIAMGGGAGMGMTLGQNTTGETQQSLIINQINAKSTLDLNILFANAVINLLQQQIEF